MAAFHPDYEKHPAEDLFSSQYAQHVAAAKRITAIKEGAASRGFTFALLRLRRPPVPVLLVRVVFLLHLP